MEITKCLNFCILVAFCLFLVWLHSNPEQGDSEALATWTYVRISFAAPFLFFACMICFNFVIACWLYCFNVDVFVFYFCFFFIFGKKLLVFFVYITCRIEIKFYLLTLTVTAIMNEWRDVTILVWRKL
jgi:hypothetical protein